MSSDIQVTHIEPKQKQVERTSMRTNKTPRTIREKIAAMIVDGKDTQSFRLKVNDTYNRMMNGYLKKGDSPDRKARRLKQLAKGMIQ